MKALIPSHDTQQTILAQVRIITGIFIAYHGFEVFDSVKMAEYGQWESLTKINGPFMAYLGKGAEFVAGIMLILGWQTRLGSIILIGTMAYIAFFIGNGKIWYEDQHPFMYVLLGFVYLALGGGKWALDKE